MDSLKVSEFQGSAQSNQIFVPIPDPNVCMKKQFFKSAY